MIQTFICPDCKSLLLNNSSNSYLCNKCNKGYLREEGVLKFSEKNDQFYEDHYTATINIELSNKNIFIFWIYLYLINSHYLYYVNKYINKGSYILDIACGGGIKYLAQIGKVTGLDLSYASLIKTTKFYENSVLANALNIPFCNNYFGAITSCYGFEHFSYEDKFILLEEMNRVLKPSGIVVMLFDCDNNNFLFRWLKKDKKLYNERIIELDKHYGLQTASENIKLIEKAGFKIIKFKGFNKTIFQHLSVFGWMQPYRKKNLFVKLILKIHQFIIRYKMLSFTYQGFVTVLDDLVDKLLPLDNARLLLIIAKKEK